MSNTPAPEGIERTETGEIKDQSPSLLTTPTTEATTETSGQKSEPPTEPDGKSLLTQEPAKAQGAPEKYEAFKVPDGFEITEAANKEIDALFKGLGLSQEAGQKLVDFYAAKTAEAANAPYDMYNQMRKGWQDEVKGRYGSKLSSDVLPTISRALDTLGDAKLVQGCKDAMDLTGAGDNPAFIDLFYRMAQRLSEGSPVRGNGPVKEGQRAPGTPRTAAQAMYPHLTSVDAVR